MKKVMLVLTLVCCFLLSRVEATLYFNDGLVHDVTYQVTGHSGALISNNFWNEPTTVNVISGANTAYSFLVYDTSVLNIYGEIYYAHSFDNSQINVTWGAQIKALRAYNNSQIIMIGGLVRGNISIYHDATVVLSGGTVNGRVNAVAGKFELHSDGIIEGILAVHNHNETIIYGGQIRDGISIERYLSQERITSVTVVGRDFFLDGRSTSGLFINESGQLAHASLTGTYFNGDPIDLNLQMHPGARIFLVPEPATLSLLGIGAYALLARKRAKR